mmetsp:Transcript_88233/g.201626  ORF Transcript_88233/g.201626 Transcript_88233/m.201626 type:complete len:133 (-) Transcript_88233:279-677(-)
MSVPSTRWSATVVLFCAVEQRLPKLSGSPLHLEPFKGYMVALEQGVPHPVFYALNISGPPKSSSPPTISLAFERRLRNVTQFAALRRSTPGAESDFFAFLRTDGGGIEKRSGFGVARISGGGRAALDSVSRA